MTPRLLLILLALALAACSKLTAENYSKLKVGMPYPEVKALLGDPDRCQDVVGLKSCVWGEEGEGKRHIQVNFIGDQAIVFSAGNLR